MPDTVLWLRRDLRLLDQPALHAAARAADGGRVVPVFVLDPALWSPAGAPRQAWLARSLAALSESMDGALVVREGDPATVLAQVADEVGAITVHVSADAGPYGRERDERVEQALAQGSSPSSLVRTGSPYAVGPGSVTKDDGTPYAVFTPFLRAWSAHGFPRPAGPPPADLRWASGVESDGLPAAPDLDGVQLPDVGEQAALVRWREFLEGPLAEYGTDRDRPDLEGTSGLSAHLKYGEVHPRTLLADLAHHPGPGAEVFRTELAWRDFYADVLWRQPRSAREYLRAAYARMRYDEPGPTFHAWCEGRTGFPFVDAGMRQLRAVGWVHNRVRMVVASFLVKDLHLEWQHGARYFMQRLRDGDLASNQHGWQWVAGSGTDAAPYFRVFNPVTQGEKFDPDGSYVRRYVPELAHLPAAAAHQPWAHPAGYAHGYPQRVVDHAAERLDALARLAEIKGS